MNSPEFYDAIYTANPHKWTSPVRNMMAFSITSSYFDPYPRTMLDIGCGNGHTLAYFAGRWPHTKYYGLDLSPEACRLSQEKNPRAEIICGTFGQVELPQVELITILGTIEHFEDLETELKNLRAMGGIIYIEAPNCLAMSADFREGFKKTTDGADQLEWHLARSSWEKKFIEAGFEIKDTLIGFTRPTEFIWVLK